MGEAREVHYLYGDNSIIWKGGDAAFIRLLKRIVKEEAITDEVFVECGFKIHICTRDVPHFSEVTKDIAMIELVERIIN